MENFLTKFTPVSFITIFTALLKRVETNEWTNDHDKKVENFVRVFSELSNTRCENDEERTRKFKSFGTGDALRCRASY